MAKRSRTKRRREEEEDERPSRRSRDKGRRSKRKGKSKKGSFKYKKRSKEAWEKRSEQSGFSRRGMLVDGTKSFKPKEGDNLVRVLPPTWDDAEHYGYEVYVHYSVGPDNDSFLCPKVMKGDPCPICEERSVAMKDNDKEYADKLNAKKRVLTYVVDRDNEDEGALAWMQPWTLDADVTTLAVDKRSGEVLDIDDPDEGYDIEFKKTGKGVGTKYVGIAIARKSSELDNPEALEQAIETPLPELLKFYPYEEMEKVFNAGGGAYDDEDDEDDDDDDDKPRRKKGKGKSKSSKRKKKYEEEDEDEDEEEEDNEDEEEDDPEIPTWDEVQEMDLEELNELIDEHELEIDGDIEEDDDEELEDLRLEICEELEIEKPKKRKPKKSEKKKLRRRGR